MYRLGLTAAALVATATAAPQGAAKTTRYWDCCKPSCSWSSNAGPVTGNVRTCDRNDNPLASSDVKNVCSGGGNAGVSYMCTDQQPFAVNNKYAYGFAAANVDCSMCYELDFTSTSLASTGKKMIVQVTNKGGDLGNLHFDIQLPGGGFGIFNGCSGQAPNGKGQFDVQESKWGARYGGLSSLSQCKHLPAKLRSGCEFRFGWFQNADNPAAQARRVRCPQELVTITGSQRLDDSNYPLVDVGDTSVVIAPPPPPVGVTPPPSTPWTPPSNGNCPSSGQCGCGWANAGNCATNDGTRCNIECCCKFRGGSEPPTNPTPKPPTPKPTPTPTPTPTPKPPTNSAPTWWVNWNSEPQGCDYGVMPENVGAVAYPTKRACCEDKFHWRVEDCLKTGQPASTPAPTPTPKPTTPAGPVVLVRDPFTKKALNSKWSVYKKPMRARSGTAYDKNGANAKVLHLQGGAAMKRELAVANHDFVRVQFEAKVAGKFFVYVKAPGGKILKKKKVNKNAWGKYVFKAPVQNFQKVVLDFVARGKTTAAYVDNLVVKGL